MDGLAAQDADLGQCVVEAAGETAAVHVAGDGGLERPDVDDGRLVAVSVAGLGAEGVGGAWRQVAQPNVLPGGRDVPLRLGTHRIGAAAVGAAVLEAEPAGVGVGADLDGKEPVRRVGVGVEADDAERVGGWAVGVEPSASKGVGVDVERARRREGLDGEESDEVPARGVVAAREGSVELAVEGVACHVGDGAGADEGQAVEVVGQAGGDADVCGEAVGVEGDSVGGDGDVVGVAEGPVAAAPHEEDVGAVDRARGDGLVEGHIDGREGGVGEHEGSRALIEGLRRGCDERKRVRVGGVVDAVVVVVGVGVVVQDPGVPSGGVIGLDAVEDPLVELVAEGRGTAVAGGGVAELAELLDEQGHAQGDVGVGDVVVHPVEGIRVRDAPVLRPGVGGGEVDLGHVVVDDKVAPHPAGVLPVAGPAEVEALGARAEQVVGVDALDVGGHLLDPALERLERPRALDVPRLVGELPGHDGGIVLVGYACEGVDAVEDGGHVVLVPSAGVGVGVEVGPLGRVRGIAVDGVPADIDVHATVVVPEVDEGDDETEAELAGPVDDVVEADEDALAVDAGRGLERLAWEVGVGLPEAPGADRLEA